MQHIDFIGDVHGHADELEALLRKMGYSDNSGYYKNESRKAFFVGDLIDRGPKIREVLKIVKEMVDHGSAYTVIGNHEYNAICYHTRNEVGEFMRAHTDSNKEQHQGTLDALGEDELLSYLEWFRTLPIYFENDSFRVIHAHWHQQHVLALRKMGVNNFSDLSFLRKSTRKGSEEFVIVDCLLKGEELPVPGVYFEDVKGRKKRCEYRTKWWMKGEGLPYTESLFEYRKESPHFTRSSVGYRDTEPPVFLGHYWLTDTKPSLRAQNVCCLDFSVAKGGFLSAYRWDGEQALDDGKFEYV